MCSLISSLLQSITAEDSMLLSWQKGRAHSIKSNGANNCDIIVKNIFDKVLFSFFYCKFTSIKSFISCIFSVRFTYINHRHF